MPLNTSGPISLGGATAGQSINLELSQPATSTVALNDTNVRTLAGVPGVATQIVMPTDFYGKPIASGYAMWARMTPNRVVNNGGNGANVLKTPDDFIIHFFSRGQSSWPNGQYVLGVSGTVRVNEPTGNIAWVDQYTYGNIPSVPGPSMPGSTVLQSTTMGINPTGTSIFQYDAYTSTRPPVLDLQSFWAQTQIIKNFSNGVPTTFNYASPAFARTSTTGWNFANGNTLIRYPTTFPLPAAAGTGTYIVNPSGTIIGNPFRYSPVPSPGGVGIALQRLFYADNTKTDVLAGYSGQSIPPGAVGASNPGPATRTFAHYTRFSQDGTVAYARWIANSSFQPGTPGVTSVLGSPPAIPYHVGIRSFNANFPNAPGQQPNNIMFWKFNRTNGEFTGNVFYWSNQPTTPNPTSAFPFAPGVGLNSTLTSTGKFLNINTIPTTNETCLRLFDSDPTFNNYASFIATGRDGSTVIPTSGGPLTFSAIDHGSENLGNTIFEEGDFMYLIFQFQNQSFTNPVVPWDVCILKTKKDGTGITNGLTITSPAFNKSITFTSTTNRPLYETTGWIGGTLDRTVGADAFPGFNLAAPKVNVSDPTYTAQKLYK